MFGFFLASYGISLLYLGLLALPLGGVNLDIRVLRVVEVAFQGLFIFIIFVAISKSVRGAK